MTSVTLVHVPGAVYGINDRQRDLLRAVNRGEVFRDANGTTWIHPSDLSDPSPVPVRLVDSLSRRFITIPESDDAVAQWGLTAAGSAVVARMAGAS